MSNNEKTTYRPQEMHDEPCKYIDLGLSVKWADRNVGAKSPKEYGDYLSWGGTTRRKDIKVPTIEQWYELMENCNWEWEGNGYKITGKNGNSIFLPAAGFWLSFVGHPEYIGSDGHYWSRTLCEEAPMEKAYYACFYSGGYRTRRIILSVAQSVRPISE